MSSEMYIRTYICITYVKYFDRFITYVHICICILPIFPTYYYRLSTLLSNIFYSVAQLHLVSICNHFWIYVYNKLLHFTKYFNQLFTK